MRPLEPALIDLALAQHGAFSSAQAHSLGVSDVDLHHLVRCGAVRRVRRGAFLLASTPQLEATPEERYAASVRAVLQARGAQTWASHHAALAIGGLPLVAVDFDRFDLCARVKRSFRRSGVVTHPLPAGEACLLIGGVRTVSAELAIVQTAAASGLKAALVAVDAALHTGLVERECLAAAADRAALGRRQRHVVDRVLQLADGSSESPGETLTRMLLTGLGWQFRSQAEIRDSNNAVIARVDFLVEETIVVEFDGLLKYDGVQGREALAREKRREDRLRALGYEVVRLTWADLDQPERLARLLREAKARVRRTGRAPGRTQ